MHRQVVMKTMTRQDAKAAGLTRYFTGKPCKHGHLAERRMSDGCVVCAYIHATTWQKAHPEKVSAKGAAYRSAKREVMLEKNRVWRKENPEKHKELTRAWRAANPDRVKETKAAWKKENAGQVNAATMRRFAEKRKRTPAWADQEKIDKVYALCARYRALGLDVQVDHQIPLQGKTVSGLHVHNNLQIISAQANRSKSNIF